MKRSLRSCKVLQLDEEKKRAIKEINAKNCRPSYLEEYEDDVKGKGIKTTKRLLENEFITYYKGKYTTRITGMENYCIEVQRGEDIIYIDATEEDESFGRLLNDNHETPNVYLQIVKLDQELVPCFFAKHQIEEGSILEYEYGGNSRYYPWRWFDKKRKRLKGNDKPPPPPPEPMEFQDVTRSDERNNEVSSLSASDLSRIKSYIDGIIEKTREELKLEIKKVTESMEQNLRQMDIKLKKLEELIDEEAPKIDGRINSLKKDITDLDLKIREKNDSLNNRLENIVQMMSVNKSKNFLNNDKSVNTSQSNQELTTLEGRIETEKSLQEGIKPSSAPTDNDAHATDNSSSNSQVETNETRDRQERERPLLFFKIIDGGEVVIMNCVDKGMDDESFTLKQNDESPIISQPDQGFIAEVHEIETESDPLTGIKPSSAPKNSHAHTTDNSSRNPQVETNETRDRQEREPSSSLQLIDGGEEMDCGKDKRMGNKTFTLQLDDNSNVISQSNQEFIAEERGLETESDPLPEPTVSGLKEKAKQEHLTNNSKWPCPYCGSQQKKSELTRHILVKHKSLPDIKTALKFPQEKRRLFFDLLKKKGIEKANEESLKSTGKLKYFGSLNKKGPYAKCLGCAGFYNKYSLHSHLLSCKVSQVLRNFHIDTSLFHLEVDKIQS